MFRNNGFRWDCPTLAKQPQSRMFFKASEEGPWVVTEKLFNAGGFHVAEA